MIRNSLLKSCAWLRLGVRSYCSRNEKSLNQVTLLGRVGIDPQERGSESHPVMIFTMATNSYYKKDSGEITSHTDWHRISVYKPNLRDIVLKYVKKGNRVLVNGSIRYGTVMNDSGFKYPSSSIIADDIILFSPSKSEAWYETE